VTETLLLQQLESPAGTGREDPMSDQPASPDLNKRDTNGQRSFSLTDMARGLHRNLGVLALSGLLRDTEHCADLRPGAVGLSRRPDCLNQGSIEFPAPVCEFCDRAQRRRIGHLQVCAVDPVRPLFQCFGSLCSCRGHRLHQPFKNFALAVMAWITATPSSSSTTPTSSGSPARDGPTNIVTLGSSVSNARQWCRIACSMSSSVTPCLRCRLDVHCHRLRPTRPIVNSC